MIIPGFSKYDITEDGVVTCVATGIVVSSHIVRSMKHYPYRRVMIWGDDGQRHACNLIRLLALAFLRMPEERCVARAKDGNNLNTVLSNAEWVPYAAYTKHAWEAGKMANRKKRHNNCDDEFVAEVYKELKRCSEPTTVAAISNKLNKPYSMTRYAVTALIQRGMARKLKKGFEAI